jgi:hypothetical protein
MSHKLTVKANDKVNAWFVFMDGRPVEGFNKEGEKLLTLAPGRHRLTYQVSGTGGSLTMDIAEKPPIVTPPGTTWPVTAKVPAGQTGTSDRIAFEVA